jgi:hypothetical protein
VKRFTIITILAALLASGQADAALVASKAECLSACVPQIAGACGGLRRAKYNRCWLTLVRQCRRFGPETVCPAPPPTTTTIVPVGASTTTTILAPPSTTTTTFAVLLPTTTTTTILSLPTTTTTLPGTPDLRGSYQLDGVVTTDTCGMSAGVGSVVSIPIDVTTQTDRDIFGSINTVFAPDGEIVNGANDWFLAQAGCPYVGCCTTWRADVYGVPPATGQVNSGTSCPGGGSCSFVAVGTVY